MSCSTPSCKSCPSGQVCQLTLQTCDSCSQAICRDVSKGSGPSAGAIVGGVVGGLAGVALVLGVLVWYKFRHKRRQGLKNALSEPDFDTPPPSPHLLSAEHSKPYDDTQRSGIGGMSRRIAPSMITSVGASQLSASNIIPIYVGGDRNHSDETLSSGQRNTGNPEFLGEPARYDIAVQGHPSLIDVNRDRSRQDLVSGLDQEDRDYMPLYPPSRASSSGFVSNLPEEAVLYHQRHSKDSTEY